MKSFKGVLCIAFTTSIGSLGCGAEVADETISQTADASTIGGWTSLVGMGSTGSYTLTADINASGKTWTPKNFSGTFDGGNHTISNLTIASGSFFGGLTNATIKNVKFTNLTLTGSTFGGIGGLASSAVNTTIQNCAVEANINVGAISAGGLVASMRGGSIFRSYAKGTITGLISYSGGLVGIAEQTAVGPITITESYAQVTVNPTAGAGTLVVAGGLVGYANAPDIHDVYAVGNVTGRGAVGGIVGAIDCIQDQSIWLLYKTIYRGDVVDKDLSASGGWAGALGTYATCTGRFAQNFYDRLLDPSANHVVFGTGVQGFTTDELKSPTSVIGGVFCAPDVIPSRCGDNTWQSPPWTAGTNMQHHALLNMPGPNAQPR